MKKKVLELLFMFCAFGFFATAQEFSPFISSPYAGVTAGKLNPASIAGSKYRFDITLFGASSGVHNDLLILSSKKLILKPSFYKDMWGHRDDFFDLRIPTDARNDIKHYVRDGVSANWDKDTYGGYFSGQYDILNVMYSVNERLAVAAGFSRRWQASANGIPREVAAEALSSYVNQVPVYSGDQTWEGPTTTDVAMYSQLFVSAAYTFYQQGNHLLKGGLTAKLLFSGTSAFTFMENYQGHLRGGARISPVSGTTFGEAGYALDSKLGFGADIGVEYEYRPEDLAGDEVGEYRWKAGLSLLDFGGFKSKGADYRDLNNGVGRPTGIESLLGQYGGAKKGEYSMSLPTVLTASVDYRFDLPIPVPLFLNFTPYIAMGRNSAHKVSKFTSFNLIPHAEWKNFGVSIPLQYDQYGKFTAGIGLRAFRHVWIGSNTVVKNFFPGGNDYSADLHVMVKIPIYGSNDRDNDGVTDKKDRCPDVPGLKKYQGCPDTDGDGIPDDQDACPNDAGPASTNGCPDKDGDGIPDKDDRCPDLAGSKELQGCPDKDGDGVADIDDECPDQAGTKATKGCPDTDGDGVPDKDDRCPDQAGPVSLKGCPDSDGDGVPDIDDECPDQAGTTSNKGCPLAQDIQNVEFDIDKYNIKPQYQPELDKAVDILSKNPNANVTVAGHTDNTYTRAYNIQLSKRRAEAVKNYFVQKNIDAQRISIEYYGFDKPIADNNTVDGRSRNRRSEVTIVIK
jgi:outer membrane protein OmpA-like peptidoglycan-associated protein